MRKLLLIVLITTFFTSEIPAQGPRSIETKIMSRLANLEKWSNYGPNTRLERLDKENKLFKKELLEYTKRPETLSYAFPRVKKKMHIVTSKDGRLRIYSWDMQTGGTMHDFDAVYQYRGASGRIYSYSDPDGADGFYHDLFQLNTRSGPIYMSVATFIASSRLLSESISIKRIEGEKLLFDSRLIRTDKGLQNSISFEYDFESVMDRTERPVKLFVFDETARSFSFPVIADDEEMQHGRVTDNRIRYRFDGRYFVRVS